MKVNSKILVCYNAPVSVFSIYNGKPNVNEFTSNDLSENGFINEISVIKNNLSVFFTEVKAIPIDRNVEHTIGSINEYNPDIIFNFVESVEGIASYEFCMAGLYQLLGYNFTGNLPATLGNCLNKSRTKNILASFGISTPKSTTLKPFQQLSENNFDLSFPVILKLLKEDASIGISELSVVENINSLKKHLNFLWDTYNQEVIVEEYINGRELNAAVLGDSVLPISEINFDGLPDDLPKIVTYEGKWIEKSVYYKHTKPVCPARLNKDLKNKIEKTALLAFEAMGCRDYARIDFRIDKNGNPFVIEVNPNPDISTDSGFARASASAGIPYPELLKRIADFALTRENNDSQNRAS
ncbi:MAG TPA: ATP-grasp domain-containing protein [Ignavibacteriaceae bacterium]|nr:ATP-grasp domain-containing protein [Ignavibacteriaceae bacterium]